MEYTRRRALAQLGLAGLGALVPFPLRANLVAEPGSLASQGPASACPFRLAVINDEITQDFGRACEVAAQEFGLHLIEIRGMWGKNIMRLDAKEIAEAAYSRSQADQGKAQEQGMGR